MAANKPHKKVKREQKSRKYALKRAITHIKLDLANAGKVTKLDALANEYMRLTQLYCDWLIERGEKIPNRNADLPQVTTVLSARWQRCAWRQACGIVQSWFSNERTNPPLLKAISIQADANVVALQKSQRVRYDYWLQLATLEKGHPVFLPVKLYQKAAEAIAKAPHLSSGVRLEKRDGQWYLTLLVGQENRKAKATQGVVGVDIGMKSMLVTSNGGQYGQLSEQIQRRVEWSKAKLARKQKLNACLQKKCLPKVGLSDGRTERYVRNEIGRAINQMLAQVPTGAALALERLNVKDMRFKSRQMNRWLRSSQLGYISDRLRKKLDTAGIRYRSVQAAYSSQQCSACGYLDKANRSDQEHFHCIKCGFSANADVNAALNIAKRFGDDELNQSSFKDVRALLDARYQAAPPVVRSATAGLEPRGMQVNQPSQPNVYIYP